MPKYSLSVLPVHMHGNIRVDGECWLWTGRIAGKGYARCWNGVRDGWAHRYSYECAKGEIPEGYHIDHLCSVRHCVNPAHLEAVTPRENHLRSRSREVTKARHSRQTHCKRGHPLNGDNLYINNGLRTCITCQTESLKKYRDKNRPLLRARDRLRYAKKHGKPTADILAEIERLTAHPTHQEPEQ